MLSYLLLLAISQWDPQILILLQSAQEGKKRGTHDHCNESVKHAFPGGQSQPHHCAQDVQPRRDLEDCAE